MVLATVSHKCRAYTSTTMAHIPLIRSNNHVLPYCALLIPGQLTVDKESWPPNLSAPLGYNKPKFRHPRSAYCWQGVLATKSECSTETYINQNLGIPGQPIVDEESGHQTWVLQWGTMLVPRKTCPLLELCGALNAVSGLDHRTLAGLVQRRTPCGRTKHKICWL